MLLLILLLDLDFYLLVLSFDLLFLGLRVVSLILTLVSE